MNPNLALVFVIAGTLANAGSATTWPQFRGPTGLGYVTDTNLPLSWNGKTGEGIAWKASLPKSDNAYSSPVIWEDRVFVTCVQNLPLEHTLLCFSLRDGHELWRTNVAPGRWLLKDLRGGY